MNEIKNFLKKKVIFTCNSEHYKVLLNQIKTPKFNVSKVRCIWTMNLNRQGMTGNGYVSQCGKGA